MTAGQDSRRAINGVLDDLDKRYRHHPPGPATIPIHEDLRTEFRLLAGRVADLGSSRETSLALTHLEEALMWANAHVARNLDPQTGEPK